MLREMFEYDPVAREAFLIQIKAMKNEIEVPEWLVTMMWVMQFDDEYYQLARDIWAKFDMKLMPTSLYLQSPGNIYTHFRSPNTTIFDMSVKAACAALDLHKNKADKVFDDLLKWFDDEVEIVKRLAIEALE